MKKALNYRQYKDTLKTLNSLSLNDFNRWIESVYKSGMWDGVNSVESEYDGAIKWDDESFYNFLITIPGVGDKLATRIVNATLDEWEKENAQTEDE